MKETIGTYRITDLEISERPRERLAKYGANVLSNAELLAILLRVGLPGENAVHLANRLLVDFKGVSGLHRAPFEDVRCQRGVGTAKAAQIKAALELGIRLRNETPEEKPAVHSPKDIFDLIGYHLMSLEQEELHVVLLDTRNRLIETVAVYKGSLNSSQVRVGELFRDAIRRSANAIVVVHNHPSGDPTPSPDDVAVTRAIIQAGKLLDVEVLDHLVVGGGKFVSLKERNLAFG